MLAGWFSPPPDPAEQMKKWKMELIKQQRQLDHEIRGIELEEAKVKKQIKDAAKRNDTVVARTLAKELVRSRKSKERLYTSKAQMNSVVMSLRSHMATIKMAKTMAKSAEIMTYMNQLIKLPQFNAVMQTMAREMEKAGLIDEMMNDTLDSMDDEGIDEAADTEVNKVLDEITATLPVAANSRLPEAQRVPAAAAAAREESANEDKELMARVAGLKAT